MQMFGFTSDSFDFANRCCTSPRRRDAGIDFDPVHGHQYIRFFLCALGDDMREAVARSSDGSRRVASRMVSIFRSRPALWPNRSDVLPARYAPIFLVVAGQVLLALSAKISWPLPYVPMTLQTLASC